MDRPEVEEHQDIRFLTIDEVEALLGAVSDDEVLRPTDRALYMTAAMTGLRQGELLALRWRDVDWPAARLRVRQNYVRGHSGTPKSRRGSRWFRWSIGWRESWSVTSSARRSRPTTSSSSRIRTPERSSTIPRWCGATRRRS